MVFGTESFAEKSSAERIPAEKSPDSNTPVRPNVIYIMSDDHTAESISAYSHLAPHLKGFVRTPNIDRLGKEGMRFNNVYCNFSLCSPSRASIITGQYSHRTGVRRLGGRIRPDCAWVSTALQNAGYKTALIGKWHLDNTPQGFDHYEVIHDQGDYFNPVFHTPAGKTSYQGYATDVYTDRALAWLQKQTTGNQNPQYTQNSQDMQSSQDTQNEQSTQGRQDTQNGRFPTESHEPFFLMLHYKAPHYSFEYPDRAAKLFDGQTIPEPSNLHEDRSGSPLLKTPTPSIVSLYYPLHKDDTNPPMGQPEEDTYEAKTRIGYQHVMKKYLRCVSVVDENVGRILNWLDENGLAKNTIVIYTSDQGYWLGQHGLYDKRIILDESIRMPFLVRYPEVIPAGSVNRDLVSNVDFAPTFLDMACSSTAKEDMPSIQGRSFYPLMRGEKISNWRESLFYCYTSQPAHWGLRTRDYTLACFPGTDEVEFYDNRLDPQQNINRAGDPAYRSIIKTVQHELDSEMDRIEISPQQLPGGQREYEDTIGEAPPL